MAQKNKQTDRQTDRQTGRHCDCKTESAQWANSGKSASDGTYRPTMDGHCDLETKLTMRADPMKIMCFFGVSKSHFRYGRFHV